MTSRSPTNLTNICKRNANFIFPNYLARAQSCWQKQKTQFHAISRMEIFASRCNNVPLRIKNMHVFAHTTFVRRCLSRHHTPPHVWVSLKEHTSLLSALMSIVCSCSKLLLVNLGFHNSIFVGRKSLCFPVFTLGHIFHDSKSLSSVYFYQITFVIYRCSLIPQIYWSIVK